MSISGRVNLPVNKSYLAMNAKFGHRIRDRWQQLSDETFCCAGIAKTVQEEGIRPLQESSSRALARFSGGIARNCERTFCVRGVPSGLRTNCLVTCVNEVAVTGSGIGLEKPSWRRA